MTTDEHLPQDIPAEHAALGAMMLNRRAIDDLVDTLAPEDFFRAQHETICRAIYDLHNQGEPVDLVTVTKQLGPDVRNIGGPAYLHTIISNTPSTTNALIYADSIRAHALRRRLIHAATQIAQKAQGGRDADETADEARQIIETAATTTGAATEHHVGSLLDDALDAIDPSVARDVNGVPTGWPEVDALLLPLGPGQMVVVGGRPAVGKSVIGLDLARHAAISRHEPTVLLSLEMGNDEVMQRMLAAEARASLTHLRSRTLDESAWSRIAKATGRIAEAPFWIDDTPHAGIQHLRAIVRRRKPTVVVVDYLQLLFTEKAENRQQAVSALSRELKLLAKRERVCVVALAQLNRGSTHRADQRPMLSDLRDSGAIEQDADVVLLLHREKDRPDVLELDVAKQRNGPTGVALLGFQGHYGRASSLERYVA